METLVEESPNPNWPVEEAHWLTATRSHIAQLAQQGQDPRFVFHNDRLSYHLEQTVGLLESSDSSTGSPRLTVHLAALFYPMGFAREATEPLAESQALARRFLLRAGLPAEKVEEVGRIMHEAHRQHPQTAGSSYLADALLGLRCPRADETDWPSLAQLEVELIKDTHDRVGWQQQELQELLTLCFHTSAGRQRWQEALGQRILAQRRKLEKARRNQSTPTQAGNGSGAFGPLEEGPAARGAQTFFRAVFRNHINLSAI
ncbi:MAG: hypothetical protein KDC54_11380, partial [Lewinella sp.]|nr:hypothetical protein [Lewinella sp.]